MPCQHWHSQLRTHSGSKFHIDLFPSWLRQIRIDQLFVSCHIPYDSLLKTQAYALLVFCHAARSYCPQIVQIGVIEQKRSQCGMRQFQCFLQDEIKDPGKIELASDLFADFIEQSTFYDKTFLTLIRLRILQSNDSQVC